MSFHPLISGDLGAVWEDCFSPTLILPASLRCVKSAGADSDRLSDTGSWDSWGPKEPISLQYTFPPDVPIWVQVTDKLRTSTFPAIPKLHVGLIQPRYRSFRFKVFDNLASVVNHVHGFVFVFKYCPCSIAILLYQRYYFILWIWRFCHSLAVHRAFQAEETAYAKAKRHKWAWVWFGKSEKVRSGFVSILFIRIWNSSL